MNDETIRLFLAALVRAIVETFGDQSAQTPAPLPAPVQEPQAAQPEPVLEKEKKPRRVKMHTFTCVDCGKTFTLLAQTAKRCPECREKLELAKLMEFRNRMRQDVNLWEGPATDADMVYGNSIDM